MQESGREGGEVGGGGEGRRRRRRGGERGEGYSHESWSVSMGRVSFCYSIAIMPLHSRRQTDLESS